MSVEVGLEGLKETILDLLQRSPELNTAVDNELRERFPDVYKMTQEQQDEVVYMLQIIKFREFLQEVV